MYFGGGQTNKCETCEIGVCPKHSPVFTKMNWPNNSSTIQSTHGLIGTGCKVLVCLFRLGNPLISESVVADQVACFTGWYRQNIVSSSKISEQRPPDQETQKVGRVLWGWLLHVGFICSPGVLWICCSCSRDHCATTQWDWPCFETGDVFSHHYFDAKMYWFQHKHPQKDHKLIGLVAISW